MLTHHGNYRPRSQRQININNKNFPAWVTEKRHYGRCLRRYHEIPRLPHNKVSMSRSTCRSSLITIAIKMLYFRDFEALALEVWAERHATFASDKGRYDCRHYRWSNFVTFRTAAFWYFRVDFHFNFMNFWYLIASGFSLIDVIFGSYNISVIAGPAASQDDYNAITSPQRYELGSECWYRSSANEVSTFLLYI